jgi:hypothetical protein
MNPADCIAIRHSPADRDRCAKPDSLMKRNNVLPMRVASRAPVPLETPRLHGRTGCSAQHHGVCAKAQIFYFEAARRAKNGGSMPGNAQRNGASHQPAAGLYVVRPAAYCCIAIELQDHLNRIQEHARAVQKALRRKAEG